MMIIRLILILSCGLYVQSAYAAPRFQSATIYMSDGEVISCGIQVYSQGIILSSPVLTQASLTYVVDNKKKLLSISDIDSIQFERSTYKKVYYSSSGGDVARSSKLLHMINEGLVIHGRLYSAPVASGSSFGIGSSFVTNSSKGKLYKRDYLLKDNDLSLVTKRNFRTVIKEYFPECENLHQVLKNKKVNFSSLDRLVASANVCATNSLNEEEPVSLSK